MRVQSLLMWVRSGGGQRDSVPRQPPEDLCWLGRGWHRSSYFLYRSTPAVSASLPISCKQTTMSYRRPTGD
ncbi:hypothetical protein SEA_YEMIJOY2021_112 [Mycobacterium phage YemiJoy2021]|uniref:Uncharacterized protein n=1 Tax=Mycobacterium phage Burrough TaxID=2488965 RepID=A0A3G8FST5_9CAUD|nr:hypothetical protein SEA_BURROUGH_111 [Mycobacterium phage Burrough]QED12027.1 hypothetical protein SEA_YOUNGMONEYMATA_112 [Mycobacterium phage YoungMoneyMata]QNJ58741.1 hypothetical protein SEA_CHAYLAJR_106 [Mycobacterium phage ChaylaJr]QOC58997.1 hypothetical protein SEA_JANIYRA_113 [Mycobacterium phage Janiyra]UDL15790.1 hypothetical protein SEA_IZAJANI_111 [Mycobacterium phage Izajani]URM87258.1 hypothetical protein SEA_JEMMNO_111 [Mycobacterium phage Jemmno]UVD40726.1 hypothetical pro